LKVVQRENLKAGKFSVHWDPPIEDHKTKPVLISGLSLEHPQGVGIVGTVGIVGIEFNRPEPRPTTPSR
jgi:hypothetical protein